MHKNTVDTLHRGWKLPGATPPAGGDERAGGQPTVADPREGPPRRRGPGRWAVRGLCRGQRPAPARLLRDRGPPSRGRGGRPRRIPGRPGGRERDQRRPPTSRSDPPRACGPALPQRPDRDRDRPRPLQARGGLGRVDLHRGRVHGDRPGARLPYGPLERLRRHAARLRRSVPSWGPRRHRRRPPRAPPAVVPPRAGGPDVLRGPWRTWASPTR